jgi:hypothetical protein
MKRLLIFALLFLPAALHAQGYRVEPSPITQRNSVAGQNNVVVVPAPIYISFCSAPANAVPCTNKATTYTDSTLGTACPTSTQVVLDGTNACVATPDTQGNWGVWVPAGQYTYTASIGAINFGPFFVTAGSVSATGISGAVSGNLIKANSATTGTDSGIAAASVPLLGAANIFTNTNTFSSVIATGISDGQIATIVTTGSSATLGGTYSKTVAFNEDATAGAAVTYTLPAAVPGKAYCGVNANNGSAPNTGVLTLQTSGAGQFIVFTDGTLSASGGFVSSAGAAADNACVLGVDSTHWLFSVQSGTWTKH